MSTVKKEKLLNNTQSDMDISRGAMLEIISHNRKINKILVEQMEEENFALLEEYTAITKGILDAAKLITDINSQTPKTVKEIEKIQEQKKSINLDDLVQD